MSLTVGQLKELLKDAPDDAVFVDSYENHPMSADKIRVHYIALTTPLSKQLHGDSVYYNDFDNKEEAREAAIDGKAILAVSLV